MPLARPFGFGGWPDFFRRWVWFPATFGVAVRSLAMLAFVGTSRDPFILLYNARHAKFFRKVGLSSCFHDEKYFFIYDNFGLFRVC
jgi:hypothetical protein